MHLFVTAVAAYGAIPTTYIRSGLFIYRFLVMNEKYLREMHPGGTHRPHEFESMCYSYVELLSSSAVAGSPFASPFPAVRFLYRGAGTICRSICECSTYGPPSYFSAGTCHAS